MRAAEFIQKLVKMVDAMDKQTRLVLLLHNRLSSTSTVEQPQLLTTMRLNQVVSQ
jgi:hypothetical protein